MLPFLERRRGLPLFLVRRCLRDRLNLGRQVVRPGRGGRLNQRRQQWDSHVPIGDPVYLYRRRRPALQPARLSPVSGRSLVGHGRSGGRNRCRGILGIWERL